MIQTGIPFNTRIQIINEAFMPLIAKPSFDTLGIKNFAEIARFIYLDAAVNSIYTGPKYNDTDYVKSVQIWREQNTTPDGTINYGGYTNCKPIQYLRKNHPEVYINLLPWLERRSE